MPEHREAVRIANGVLLSAILFLAGCASTQQPAAPEPPRFPCSSEEGYWLGRAGLGYQGWCTPGTAAAFLASHERGREIYELYRRRAMLEQEVSRMKPGDTERREAARRQAALLDDLIRRLEASPR